MKKLFMFILACFVFVGCMSSKKATEVKVLTPNGAPALSFISMYEDIKKDGEIKIVEGSELLSSELIKKESDYDVIVAPINLGCQLIAKGQTDYRLAGVLTWGNLYLLENNDVKNNVLAAFGEMAVPGKIFAMIKNSSSITKNADVTYYNAVSDVQGQVLSNKCQYALMAEPAASATIAKAKQNGINLKVVASLQNLYQKQTGSTQAGYPQAAIFVKDKEKTKDMLEQLDDFTNNEAFKDDNQIENYIEKIGADTFGVPSANIASQTWANQNIHYRDAISVKEDIQTLLKQFHIEYSDEMIIQ